MRITVGGAAVMSLLLLGLVPAIAQSNQVDQATTLIQMAQASLAYANQLLTIAQQHGINVSRAQSFVAQGNPLLAQAQSELNTNPSQASQDALSAMNRFKAAAQTVQSGVAKSGESNSGTNSTSNQVANLQEMIQRMQSKASEIQTVLTKACGAANASSTTCADGTSNLAQATADLNQASALLTSLTNASNSTNQTSTSNQTDISAIVNLMKDAWHHLSQATTDINELATAARAEMAATYVQNILQNQLPRLQQMIAQANLSSSVAQQDQAQLTQAQSLLNSALQLFRSGNFTAGVQDAKQAMQIIQQLHQELQGQVSVAYIQNFLQPRLTELQQRAQSANLSSSVAQQVQTQLSQAQSLLNSAIQSFQSGNYDSGRRQAQQAMQLMQQVQQEIEQAVQVQAALAHIQELQNRLQQDQQLAQNANLSSSVAQQVQGQLAQAQSLINSAIQSIQSGNYNTGVQQAQQASQLLNQVEQEIAHH